jgi:uncharacterized membrane protein YuzA (DUF378 family)
MWFLDFPSLVLVIAAGIQLGLLSLFGWDAAGTIFGSYAPIVFEIMGLSAIWQLLRQRFH